MSYIKAIVNHINESIKGKLCKQAPYDSNDLTGIAQMVRKVIDGKPDQVYPAIYGDKGDLEYVGFEDDHNISIYHRALSVGVGVDTKARSFGSNLPDIKNTFKMTMVVFAKRDVLKIGAEELFLKLQAAMPQQADKTLLQAEKLKTVFININECVLNEEQVFNEEYKNVDFFITPEHLLIKINYQIESTRLSGCFNTESC